MYISLFYQFVPGAVWAGYHLKVSFRVFKPCSQVDILLSSPIILITIDIQNPSVDAYRFPINPPHVRFAFVIRPIDGFRFAVLKDYLTPDGIVYRCACRTAIKPDRAIGNSARIFADKLSLG